MRWVPAGSLVFRRDKAWASRTAIRRTCLLVLGGAGMALVVAAYRAGVFQRPASVVRVAGRPAFVYPAGAVARTRGAAGWLTGAPRVAKQIITWKGDERETTALVTAIAANCIQITDNKPCDATCPAHGIMREQSTLDKLLFLRRIARRLEDEEFRRPTTPR